MKVVYDEKRDEYENILQYLVKNDYKDELR
jgi:hypothetical protein